MLEDVRPMLTRMATHFATDILGEIEWYVYDPLPEDLLPIYVELLKILRKGKVPETNKIYLVVEKSLKNSSADLSMIQTLIETIAKGELALLS